MILVGRYLSPFVRRVATTMYLYDLPFEHRPFAVVGDDREKIRDLNPVVRVPALILDDGETLVDSAAILDYLDEQVGPERALTPAFGAERRRVLKLMAVAVGAVEKATLVAYEKRYRPEEKWHPPWVEMISEQSRSGFQWLDGQAGSPWLAGSQLTQADLTTASAYEFMRIATPELFATLECPKLEALSQELGTLEAFRETAPPA